MKTQKHSLPTFAGKVGLILLIQLLNLYSFGQENTNDIDAEQLKKYKKNASSLISYMENVFNMLGDDKTSNKDKDVIINQSYLKLFEDDKTQIQDDLDENRGTLLNKDVQAYLKDIDFFFQKVNFKFDISEIAHSINERGELFLLVSMNRHIEGKTVKNKTINSNQARYVELNINQEEGDIKIASIYTVKLNEKTDLQNWWAKLPNEWHNIFGKKIKIGNNINLSDIKLFNDSLVLNKNNDTLNIDVKLLNEKLKAIAGYESIDLRAYPKIKNINPLSKLTNIKKLNISGLPIQDIMPVRSLTKLTEINCSYTQINSIEALKYATNLQKLYLNGTQVRTLNTISHLKKLETLEIANTQITNISPIKEITSLQNLTISKNRIENISAIRKLTNIKNLDCSITKIRTIDDLSQLKSLEILKINKTLIKNLSPLANLNSLKKIYCDTSGITRKHAEEFMTKKPKCIVIHKSKELTNWWKNLPKEWQKVFKRYIPVNGFPNKEQLQRIASLTEIKVAGNKRIVSSTPLIKLIHLKKLDASQSGIEKMDGLQDLEQLEYLSLNSCKVTNTQYLKKLNKLKYLNLANTKISSIDSLINIPTIRRLYIDNTPASKQEEKIRLFIKKNPQTLTIYKTSELTIWWKQLGKEWKTVFINKKDLKKIPDTEKLHQITVAEEIIFPEGFKKKKIKNINPLSKFWRLKKLDLSASGITNLSPLTQFKQLQQIDVSETAISNIEPLSKLKKLQKLSFAKTPIKDIEKLSKLKMLTELNCSGTKIRSVKDLSKLKRLKILDISNTRVKNIRPISDLKLKELKCFNSKIWEMQIDDFKKKNPKCDVVYY